MRKHYVKSVVLVAKAACLGLHGCRSAQLYPTECKRFFYKKDGLLVYKFFVARISWKVIK